MSRFRILGVLVTLSFLHGLTVELPNKSKSAFQIYGDIFQFMPLYAAGYSVYQKDYSGLKHLALSSLSAISLTFASKLSFVKLSKTHPHLASISQRPDSKSFDGFPSGHTSAAFVGAGYLAGRYGKYIGTPAFMAASFVGLSRIYALRHTPAQVVAGALLGFSLGYFINEKFVDEKLELSYSAAGILLLMKF